MLIGLAIKNMYICVSVCQIVGKWAQLYKFTVIIGKILSKRTLAVSNTAPKCSYHLTSNPTVEYLSYRNNLNKVK